MAIQLAPHVLPAFKGLSDTCAARRFNLYDFINYLSQVNSYHFVRDITLVYDITSNIQRRYTTNLADNITDEIRNDVLSDFFREGAIIEFAPGERIVVEHDGEGWSTEIEMVGRYSVKSVWINQNDQKVFETEKVMELYEYILSKFDE